MTWRWRGGGKSSIGYRANWAGDHMVVTLDYRHGKQGVCIPVRLQTSPVHFGGFRWWFTCPLSVNDVPCRRRVAKLYSARGPYFGCRRAWGWQLKARLSADIRRGHG